MPLTLLYKIFSLTQFESLKCQIKARHEEIITFVIEYNPCVKGQISGGLLIKH